MPKICIDPGHGSYDSGAVGQNGTLEKNITLSISQLLADKLKQKKIDVLLTRYSDITPWNKNNDLQTRCNIANNWNADLFISIHNDASSNLDASGTTTYCYQNGTESEKIAQLVQNELINSLGLYNRGVRTANYYVLRNTNMPAILIEVAFISNLEEEKLLNDFDFQNKCAEAIFKGTCKYFGINIWEENNMKLIKKEPQKIQYGIDAIMNLKARGILSSTDEHIAKLKESDENSLDWLNLVIADRIAEKVGIKKIGG